MSKTIIAALVFGALIAASPVMARDYAYCLQGRQAGYPGNCNFKTFQQCKAAASGTEATCAINPKVAAHGRQR